MRLGGTDRHTAEVRLLRGQVCSPEAEGYGVL